MRIIFDRDKEEGFSKMIFKWRYEDRNELWDTCGIVSVNIMLKPHYEKKYTLWIKLRYSVKQITKFELKWPKGLIYPYSSVLMDK